MTEQHIERHRQAAPFSAEHALRDTFTILGRFWASIGAFGLAGAAIATALTQIWNYFYITPDVVAALAEIEQTKGDPEMGPLALQHLTSALYPAIPGSLLMFAVWGLLAMVLVNALTMGTITAFKSGEFPLLASLDRSLQKFMPLLGAQIVAGLAIFAGFLLLIVPGILLSLRYAVIAPVILIEDTRPLGALTRSRALTKGYRWEIFKLLMMISLILGGISILFTMLSLVLPAQAETVTNFAKIALSFTLTPTAIAVAYVHMRQSEGI